MAQVSFRVVGVSQWGFSTDDGDRVFPGSTEEPHTETFTKAELKLLAAAAAAGYVEVTAGDVPDTTESQEDSEKAYAKAQADGSWQHGNLEQFVQEAPDRIRRLKGAPPNPDLPEAEAQANREGAIAFLDTGVAQALQIQRHMKVGADYDTAVRRTLGQEEGES